MFLNLFAEDRVQHIDIFRLFRKFKMQFLCRVTHIHFTEIHARDFLERAVKGNALPGPFEVQGLLTVRDLFLAIKHRHEVVRQLFREAHHVFVIRVCLIKFYHGEFGIMTNRNSFVAKITIDLIDLFKTAHEKPLQIKFGRYAKIEVRMKRVMMRHKGLRAGAAGQRLHHGRFHFHKTPLIKERTDLTDDATARFESRSHFVV